MPHPLRPFVVLSLLTVACAPAEERDRGLATAESDGTGLLALAEPRRLGVPTTDVVLGDSPVRPRRRPKLSPLADSIARALAFVPRTEQWFAVAARDKRLLVDLGRVDTDVRGGERAAAYREAVSALSPLAVGTRLRLFAPWGADDVTISGFSASAGRIVATIDAPPRVDSLARRLVPFAAAARRVADSTAATSSSCRAAVSPEVRERGRLVADSVAQRILADGGMPPYERYLASRRVRISHAVGCFPRGSMLLLVSVRAGQDEWVREQVVLLDSVGVARAVPTEDFRFKAHDTIYAFDANGDGIDDLAARGVGHRTGAIVILAFDGRRRLQRLASGFGWESP